MKRIFIEFTWLALCLCISLLLVALFSDWNTSLHSISIKLSGTHVAFSEGELIVSLWMLFSFLLFFCKEFMMRFQRTVPILILLFCGITFLFTVNALEPGWTSYPPLTGIGADVKFTYDKYMAVRSMLRFLVFIGIAVTLVLWLGKRHKAK